MLHTFVMCVALDRITRLGMYMPVSANLTQSGVCAAMSVLCCGCNLLRQAEVQRVACGRRSCQTCCWQNASCTAATKCMHKRRLALRLRSSSLSSRRPATPRSTLCAYIFHTLHDACCCSRTYAVEQPDVQCIIFELVKYVTWDLHYVALIANQLYTVQNTTCSITQTV